MTGSKARRAWSSLLGFAMALIGTPSWAGYGDVLNMPVGVTPISRQAYDVHMLMFWICCIIGVVVFGAMIYSIIYHRKSAGHEAAQFHHSTFAEIVWTVIPFFILVGFAIPATKALIMMEDTSEAAITLKVTGYQWKWQYEYLEDEVSLFSNLALSSRQAIYADPTKVENYLLEVDNEIVLPTNKKIRIILTAADVIHAWWVPALGMKKDAIPGYVNEFWAYIEEPGVYRGQCAELCGKDHGFMPIVVVAKDEQGYRQWVAERRIEQEQEAIASAKDWEMAELVAEGESVYQGNCAACHMPDGQGVAGSYPAIAGSEIVNGSLGDHLRLVLEGRSGTAMAGFRDRLSDAELAAVITYQRNAFGNHKGDSLQPSDVHAARSL